MFIDINKEFQLIEITEDYLGSRHILHAWKIRQWNLCVRVEKGNKTVVYLANWSRKNVGRKT